MFCCGKLVATAASQPEYDVAISTDMAGSARVQGVSIENRVIPLANVSAHDGSSFSRHGVGTTWVFDCELCRMIGMQSSEHPELWERT